MPDFPNETTLNAIATLAGFQSIAVGEICPPNRDAITANTSDPDISPSVHLNRLWIARVRSIAWGTQFDAVQHTHTIFALYESHLRPGTLIPPTCHIRAGVITAADDTVTHRTIQPLTGDDPVLRVLASVNLAAAGWNVSIDELIEDSYTFWADTGAATITLRTTTNPRDRHQRHLFAAILNIGIQVTQAPEAPPNGSASPHDTLQRIHTRITSSQKNRR